MALATGMRNSRPPMSIMPPAIPNTPEIKDVARTMKATMAMLIRDTVIPDDEGWDEDGNGASRGLPEQIAIDAMQMGIECATGPVRIARLQRSVNGLVLGFALSAAHGRGVAALERTPFGVIARIGHDAIDLDNQAIVGGVGDGLVKTPVPDLEILQCFRSLGRTHGRADA